MLLYLQRSYAKRKESRADAGQDLSIFAITARRVGIIGSISFGMGQSIDSRTLIRADIMNGKADSGFLSLIYAKKTSHLLRKPGWSR